MSRPGESGRTMRIMLTSAMSTRLQRGERPVIVKDAPWELFDEQSARRTSERNHSQSIERISERGGFDAVEAVCVLTGMPWQDGKSITEDQAHRILYVMTALYRRGALASRPPTPTPQNDGGNDGA